jgi:hypothetical protein
MTTGKVRKVVILMDNCFFVYGYYDPVTDLPFYFGKGCGERHLDHLSETKDNTDNHKKWAYIQGLRNAGLEPVVIILSQGLDEDSAYEEEERLILLWGRRGIDEDGVLTNICLANRPPRSEETCKKISLALKGRPKPPFSAEHRAKLATASRGKKMSLETRAKLSTSHVGIVPSIHARLRARETHTGKVVSESTKQKLREFNLGRKRGPTSEETKLKISLAKKNHALNTL